MWSSYRPEGCLQQDLLKSLLGVQNSNHVISLLIIFTLLFSTHKKRVVLKCDSKITNINKSWMWRPNTGWGRRGRQLSARLPPPLLWGWANIFDVGTRNGNKIKVGDEEIFLILGRRRATKSRLGVDRYFLCRDGEWQQTLGPLRVVKNSHFATEPWSSPGVFLNPSAVQHVHDYCWADHSHW